jgi:hypothetical protein
MERQARYCSLPHPPDPIVAAVAGGNYHGQGKSTALLSALAKTQCITGEDLFSSKNAYMESGQGQSPLNSRKVVFYFSRVQ